MKIQGYLGEESFEIRDGDLLLERIVEAHVFSSALRTAMQLNRSAPDARAFACESVQSFRRTKTEEK